MTFTRAQAKMIAEELYKMIHKDIKEVSKEVSVVETDEWICVKEAARYLDMSVSNLYKNKDLIGCYTKINGRLKFSKIMLDRRLRMGVD